MLNFLDVGTAYFIAGLMYFTMPLLVWVSLRHARDKSVALWFWGGETFGIGLSMLALRGHVPEWVTYELGNVLLGIGSLLRVHSLQHIQGRADKYKAPIIICLLHTAGFVLGRRLLPGNPLFFIWGLVFIALEFSWIARLALNISRGQKLPSVRFITFSYVPIALLLIARALNASITHTTVPTILSSDSLSIAIAILGIITAVVSNTSFLAMFVERSAHERQANIELNAQRKATEALARQISELDRQRSLHTMAAALSHELGQPMTSIQLMTDIWRQSPQTIDAQEVLSQVHNNIGTAIGILDRMRNLGKANSIALQKVDLLDIHQQVITLMRDWLRIENVHIELHNAGSTATVQGDPVQLSQILINLYRNAVQASSNQSSHKLQIRVSNTATHVTLCVRDNGPGFSAQALQSAGRASLYTTKKDGLGMGLSIVRDILKNHNGQLTLSNHPEGGAQVQITLPR